MSAPGMERFSAMTAEMLREAGWFPGVVSTRTPVVLDPMLAMGEDDQLGGFSKILGSSLYPLGETADGHSLIAIDEQGRVFLIFGWPSFVDVRQRPGQSTEGQEAGSNGRRNRALVVLHQQLIGYAP